MGWTLVAHAAADLYSVRAVPVDATAASAIEARDIAIANGRAEAWTRMFRRLAIEADWGKQPQLDPVRLAAMVQGFSVSNERRSSTRYLADINYTLNKDEVARAMRESGAVFTEARAQPVLILPVYDGGAGNVLWGDINPGIRLGPSRASAANSFRSSRLRAMWRTSASSPPKPRWAATGRR